MTLYNIIAGKGLERLCALSDGVFAIVMTLIVLELRVPNIAQIKTEQALWTALGQLAPRMFTYLLSFLTLGIFWVGQQTQLNQLEQGDRNLSWIHFAFLSVVSLVPFSTTLLAEFVTFRAALIVYWLNLALMVLLLLWSWRYAMKAHLVRPDVPADLSRAIERRIIGAQALYAAGAALCILNPLWGIGSLILVQLIFAFAPRLRPLSRP